MYIHTFKSSPFFYSALHGSGVLTLPGGLAIRQVGMPMAGGEAPSRQERRFAPLPNSYIRSRGDLPFDFPKPCFKSCVWLSAQPPLSLSSQPFFPRPTFCIAIDHDRFFYISVYIYTYISLSLFLSFFLSFFLSLYSHKPQMPGFNPFFLFVWWENDLIVIVPGIPLLTFLALWLFSVILRPWLHDSQARGLRDEYLYWL